MAQTKIACERNAVALTWTVYEDGEVVGRIALAPAELSTEVAEAAMWHGLTQKVGDAAALGQFHTSGPKKGLKVTAADKVEAMTAVRDMLMEGLWTRRTEGGADEGGLLASAISRMNGKPLADVRADVAKLDKATQAAMRALPTVAQMIATIKAERAAAQPASVRDAAADALAAFGIKA